MGKKTIAAYMGLLLGCSVSSYAYAQLLSLSGNVGASTQVSYPTGTNNKKRVSDRFNYGISSSAFVWRPWLIKGGGQYGGSKVLAKNYTDRSERSTDNAHYGAGISLLGRSRFPFQWRGSKNDSEFDSPGSSRETQKRVKAYSQSYRSLDNLTRFNFRRKRADQERTSYFDGAEGSEFPTEGITQKSTHSSNSVNFGRELGDNLFQALLSTSTSKASDLKSDSHAYSVTHDYVRDQGFILSNLLSRVTEEEVTPLYQLGEDSRQLSSTFSWRPIDKIQLVNSFRYSHELMNSKETYGRNLARDDIVKNYNGSLNYALNQNTSYSGSVAMSETKYPSAPSNQTVSQQVNMRYRSDPSTAGVFKRTWSGGLGLSNFEAGRSVSSNLSQSFSHNYVANRYNYKLGLTQGGSLRDGVASTMAKTLRHGASLEFQPIENPRKARHALSFDDSRQFNVGGGESQQLGYQWSRDLAGDHSLGSNSNVTMQLARAVDEEGITTFDEMLDIQLNAYHKESRRSGWEGDLYYQWRRFRREREKNISAVMAGRLDYFYDSVFNVRNLDYSSKLKAEEDFDANRSIVASWHNVLEFRLGLLSVTMSATINYSGQGYGKMYRAAFTRNIPFL